MKCSFGVECTESVQRVFIFELLSGVLQMAVYEPVINVALVFTEGLLLGAFQSPEYHQKEVLCCTENEA